MLYKRIDDDYVIWRYWCECMSPDHMLEFTEDETPGEGQLSVAICSRGQDTLWRRVRTAWRVLFNKEPSYLDVCISPEDRKELGAVISGDKIA